MACEQVSAHYFDRLTQWFLIGRRANARGSLGETEKYMRPVGSAG